MQKAMTLPLASVAAAMLVAGCGSSASHSSASKSAAAAAPVAATTAAPNSSPYSYGGGAATTAAPAAKAAMITAKHDKLGTVLAVGSKKLTVYLFEGDTGQTSRCSATCAAVWPPVTGSPTAGPGALASDLGTIKRSDGRTQITYRGHPLYLFAKDQDAGDTYGEGIKSFGAEWYAIRPSGSKVDQS